MKNILFLIVLTIFSCKKENPKPTQIKHTIDVVCSDSQVLIETRINGELKQTPCEVQQGDSLVVYCFKNTQYNYIVTIKKDGQFMHQISGTYDQYYRTKI